MKRNGLISTWILACKHPGVMVIAVVLIVCSSLLMTALTVRASTDQPAQSGVARSLWDGAYSDGQAKRGQTTYFEECANCHSADLTGGLAPTLVGESFLRQWDDMTLGDLFERIRMSMPADSPGRLSARQYADVLAFLLHANGFPSSDTELEGAMARLSQIKFEPKPQEK